MDELTSAQKALQCHDILVRIFKMLPFDDVSKMRPVNREWDDAADHVLRVTKRLQLISNYYTCRIDPKSHFDSVRFNPPGFPWRRVTRVPDVFSRMTGLDHFTIERQRQYVSYGISRLGTC